MVFHHAPTESLPHPLLPAGLKRKLRGSANRGEGGLLRTHLATSSGSPSTKWSSLLACSFEKPGFATVGRTDIGGSPSRSVRMPT